MSILFRCPDAPRVRRPNPFAGDPGEPDEIETSALPVVDMTNVNGAAMLELLRLPSAPYGDIAPADLPAAIAILERQLAVARSGRRTLLDKANRDYDGTLLGVLGIAPGPDGHAMPGDAPYRVRSIGRSPAYVAARLEDMLILLRAALDHGLQVSWD